MDDSTYFDMGDDVEQALRTRLYNFYCELGWDCHEAELLAENIEIPTTVLHSFFLDMGADQDSYVEA